MISESYGFKYLKYVKFCHTGRILKGNKLVSQIELFNKIFYKGQGIGNL